MFTKHAEKKFDILAKYKIFYTKEDILNVFDKPDKVGRKNEFFYTQKGNIKVLYKKEGGKEKIITFYPVK